MSGVLVMILSRVLVMMGVVWRCSACDSSSDCTLVLDVPFCMYITHLQKRRKKMKQKKRRRRKKKRKRKKE
jgi:hypothetical protein